MIIDPISPYFYQLNNTSESTYKLLSQRTLSFENTSTRYLKATNVLEFFKYSPQSYRNLAYLATLEYSSTLWDLQKAIDKLDKVQPKRQDSSRVLSLQITNVSRACYTSWISHIQSKSKQVSALLFCKLVERLVRVLPCHDYLIPIPWVGQSSMWLQRVFFFL